MNRRTLFKSLLALPFLKCALPKAVAATPQALDGRMFFASSADAFCSWSVGIDAAGSDCFKLMMESENGDQQQR